VLAFSPLVKYVAGRMSTGLPAHVEEADLISYGLLGLISAIERFDTTREIKFETFAMTRIKGSIIDELRSLDWVPRSVRARARQIEKANALPYALAAYAFTRSASNADRLADGVEAGNLSINNLVASIAETPFGGIKDSGYGREGGSEGLTHYTVVKNVSHQMR